MILGNPTRFSKKYKILKEKRKLRIMLFYPYSKFDYSMKGRCMEMGDKKGVKNGQFLSL